MGMPLASSDPVPSAPLVPGVGVHGWGPLEPTEVAEAWAASVWWKLTGAPRWSRSWAGRGCLLFCWRLSVPEGSVGWAGCRRTAPGWRMRPAPLTLPYCPSVAARTQGICPEGCGRVAACPEPCRPAAEVGRGTCAPTRPGLCAAQRVPEDHWGSSATRPRGQRLGTLVGGPPLAAAFLPGR